MKRTARDEARHAGRATQERTLTHTIVGTPRCQGITKYGDQCRKGGDPYCEQHKHQAIREALA